MINTILFDLDGTLLRFKQDEFIDLYFSKLAKVFTGLGLDPGLCIKSVWAGTRAMMKNDGNKLNSERFWDNFGKASGVNEELLVKVEAACDGFYTSEFNEVKSIVDYSEIPERLVRKMKEKGYTLVLATNPLFPECGVHSRLEWSNIDKNAFSLITHYGNSSFCKPNLGYYREILQKIGKESKECLMVGNSPGEDMIASELGMHTFLVIDYLENETGKEITEFRRGTLVEMESHLLSMP